MKSVVALLAVTTIVSGGAAIHYTREFRQLHARADHASLAAPTGTAPQPRSDVAPAGTGVPGGTAAVAAPPPGAAPDREAIRRESAQRRLDLLRDPQGRAELGNQLLQAATGQLREMAPHIGLRTDEIEPAALALVPRFMELEQRALECRVDPACDADALEQSREAVSQEELARVIGADRAEKMMLYTESLDERSMLEQLRPGLPADSRPSEAQVVNLAMALEDERRRFIRDAEAHNEQWEVIRTGQGGYVLYSAAPADAPPDSPRRLESATRFAGQLRARAAGVLDANALATLRELEDNAIAAYRRQLEEQRLVRDARAGGG